MAVNLVGQVGRQRAAALLESSFAQFQADRGVAGLARQARPAYGPRWSSCRWAASAATSTGYAALRRQLSDREGDQARQRAAARRREALASLERLRRGDIIQVPSGRRAGIAVVLEPTAADGQPHAAGADRQPPGQAAVPGRLPGPGDGH